MLLDDNASLASALDTYLETLPRDTRSAAPCFARRARSAIVTRASPAATTNQLVVAGSNHFYIIGLVLHLSRLSQQWTICT